MRAAGIVGLAAAAIIGGSFIACAGLTDSPAKAPVITTPSSPAVAPWTPRTDPTPSFSSVFGYPTEDSEDESLPGNTKENPSGFRCKDGTYSHARHRQGACSHHGGIA